MTETPLNETGIEPLGLSPWVNEEKPAPAVTTKNITEIYKLCQDEVIKRLSQDPKESWRVPYIEEALKTHDYSGSSMELLASEVNKLVEKYF